MAVAETTLPELALPAEADLGVHPERRGPVQIADFERLPQVPEHPMELIAGWVVAMSPIGFSSGSLTRDLTLLLGPLAKEKGWTLTLDTRHRPSRPQQTVVFPDLALHCVGDEGMELAGDTVTRTPELVIEILGEETAERDRAPRERSSSPTISAGSRSTSTPGRTAGRRRQGFASKTAPTYPWRPMARVLLRAAS